MHKKKIYLIVFFILVLAFLAGNLLFPQFLKLPRFPDIPFRLGLDLQGGTHLVYEADLSNVAEKDKAEKMGVLRDVIEGRVNWYGVAEPLVQINGKSKLIVELAGVKDISQAIKIIGETPYLEFQELFSEEERQKIMDNIPEEDVSKVMQSYKEEVGQEISREEVLDFLTAGLFKPTELTGQYLKEAVISFDQTTNKPQISLQFKEEGIKLFEEITARNVGKPLAISLDGRSIIDTDGDGVITESDFYAPIVQQKISGGKAVITGDLNINKAREIVKRLNWGALPIQIGSPIYQQTVGPTLGAISLTESLKAGIFGFLAVILFMVLFYRLPGLISSLVLLIYIGLVLSVFKLVPVTLTLAGIGGFILSIGMAIDANILIFSRMREELKEGKGFSQALEEGFKRAWSSIRDGNITTLIVAFILFSFGTSFIKGFALTLSLGIIISMFSAIIITKNFLSCFVGTKLERIKFLWS
ncbi:MAG: protein translocase subunit SecD [bacterium]